MISVKLVPFEQPRMEALRRWLRGDEMSLLKQVAQAKVKASQHELLQDAMKASKENQVIERANVHLREAKEWQDFLDKLDQIATGKIELNNAIVS